LNRLVFSFGRENDEDELRKVDRLFGSGDDGSPVETKAAAPPPAAKDVEMVLLDSDEDDPEPETEPGTDDESAPAAQKSEPIGISMNLDDDDDDDDQPKPLSLVSPALVDWNRSRTILIQPCPVVVARYCRRPRLTPCPSSCPTLPTSAPVRRSASRSPAPRSWWRPRSRAQNTPSQSRSCSQRGW